MEIDARNLEFKELNQIIRDSKDKEFIIDNTLGHRYIGSGTSNLSFKIKGIPGNALGAYLNGSKIEVFGNSSDALGDTMNDGLIVIHGNSGDACGYSMRGGKIYVKGSVGYRCGIHMKAYMDKYPVIIVGENAGSFLGEYQAGGIIVVLGLNNLDRIVGNFPSTGMYGGKLFLRSKCEDVKFPEQVDVNLASDNDLAEIKEYLKEYSKIFNLDFNEIINHDFSVVTPNHNKKVKTMYVGN